MTGLRRNVALLCLIGLSQAEPSHGRLMTEKTAMLYTRFYATVGLVLNSPEITAAEGSSTLAVKRGLSLGVGTDHSLTPDETFYMVVPHSRLGLGVEALYLETGYSVPGQAEVKMSWLRIPFFLRLEIFDVVQLSGGFYWGTRLGSVQFDRKQSAGLTGAANWDSRSFSSNDFGYLLGVGLVIPGSPEKRKVFVRARYVRGMSNLYEVTGNSLKTKAVEVQLGFVF